MSNIIYLAGNHTGGGKMTKRGHAVQRDLEDNTLSLLNNRVLDNLERFLPRRPDLATKTALACALKGPKAKPSYVSNLLSRKQKKGVSLNRVEKFAALFDVDPGLFFLEVADSEMLEAILKTRK